MLKTYAGTSHSLVLACHYFAALLHCVKLHEQRSCKSFLFAMFLCDRFLQSPSRYFEAARTHSHIPIWLWKLCSNEQLIQRRHSTADRLQKPLHSCSHIQIQSWWDSRQHSWFLILLHFIFRFQTKWENLSHLAWWVHESIVIKKIKCVKKPN